MDLVQSQANQGFRYRNPRLLINIMQEVMKYRKNYSHVHVNLASTDPEVQKKYAGQLIDYAEGMKVEKLVLSNPVTRLINSWCPKRKIFFENFNNLLRKGGRNVD